jgi:hypothetical protein
MILQVALYVVMLMKGAPLRELKSISNGPWVIMTFSL